MRGLGFFLIVFVFMVILKIIAFFVNRGQTRKTNRSPQPETAPRSARIRNCAWTWMQTAGVLGLSFVRPKTPRSYPAIEGKCGRLEVLVHCRPESGGNPPETVCRIVFPLAAGIGLLIMKDRPDEVRKTAPGLKDLPIAGFLNGAEPPEIFFSVRNPEIFRNSLNPECVDFLSRRINQFPTVKIMDNFLEVRFPGIENDPRRFEARIREMLEVAESFSVLAETARNANEALTIRGPETGRANIPEAKIKQTVLPVRVGTELAPSMPKPKVIPAVPPPAPEPEAVKTDMEMETPVQPSPGPETTGTPDELAQEVLLPRLWPSGFVGDREKALFEQYRGRTVEWSGVLRSAYDYTSDFVFGSGGGTKITVEVLEFAPSGSLLKVKIKAVASLPKEAYPALKNSGGKTIRFRGELLKFEPFAKEIYMVNGHLSDK